MKQVIVVNEALDLPRGKLAAQVAHGSIAAFLRAAPSERESWVDSGMTKVVLKVPRGDDLLRLRSEAEEAGIPCCLIRDAGRTVVPAGTITCLGVGPAGDEEIDRLTGELALVE